MLNSPSVAVVVIGRNEGERLRRCLTGVLPQSDCVVYVDSASTDDSLAIARTLGVASVELDMSVPFSAARARNAGFERVRATRPDIELVQFIDGDCELHPGWIPAASATLQQRADVAIVCGRRRERFREASHYNRLCDIEWDTPVGSTDSCGGDFLMRAAVFAAVGGFNPTVIAGEEPELCYRVRRQGWVILRIDQEMTLHDAAMTRFGQWWQRTKRAGYAYALVASLHGREQERFRLRKVASILAWGGALPLFTLLLSALWGAPALALLVLYPLSIARFYRSLRRVGKLAANDARLYALACVAGKIPECVGVLRCACDLLLRRQRQIIEYKTS